LFPGIQAEMNTEFNYNLEAVRKAIPAISEEARAKSEAHWDAIAKPLKGLGELENLVTRIAALTGEEQVRLDKRAVIVMCADNGVVAEGVTQSDSSITAIMAGKISAHVLYVEKLENIVLILLVDELSAVPICMNTSIISAF